MEELQKKIGNVSDTLVVLWTSKDKDTVEKMIFMYTFNSKTRGWWENVHIIVWGGATKLLSEDTGIQETVKKCQDANITFQACLTCAKLFGVADKLEELGIETIPMGVPFTEMIKDGYHILTI